MLHNMQHMVDTRDVSGMFTKRDQRSEHLNLLVLFKAFLGRVP